VTFRLSYYLPLTPKNTTRFELFLKVVFPTKWNIPPLTAPRRLVASMRDLTPFPEVPDPPQIPFLPSVVFLFPHKEFPMTTLVEGERLLHSQASLVPGANHASSPRTAGPQ